MTGSWPYVLAVLSAVPLGGHALAADTFSTEGLVNLHDVRGSGYAYAEILSDARDGLGEVPPGEGIRVTGRNSGRHARLPVTAPEGSEDPGHAGGKGRPVWALIFYRLRDLRLQSLRHRR